MDALTPQAASAISCAADQRDTALEELARLLDAEPGNHTDHPMTVMLDMLAGLAEERSQIEGDRWEQISQAVQKCSNFVEHNCVELG